MTLYHDSWDINYRSPFGAVETGTKVTLRLDAFDIEDTNISDSLSVSVRVWTNETETFYPMEKTGVKNIPNKTDKSINQGFVAEITMPDTPCLFWYTFLIKYNDTEIKYINSSKKGGVGKAVTSGTWDSYQITVYSKDFSVPDWFCGRIMYQIFPDRFFGFHNDGHIEKSRDEYIIHYNRYEDISFNRHLHEDGPACNDFYGGNLQGIIKKLPYIKSLGVGVIYLNPIFEAYSNHKYDTANYKKIDPMFGTEKDFAKLCQEADKLDIKIILDGVFSHTGADSIYFNKYGFYGDGGAYQTENSPYRSWYSFNDNNQYESWWGCNNLPNVNEMDDSYLDYILRDEDSVIKKWLKLGASGWRLDVADELPDEFIKILRTEAKKVKPDAVIIGEVWEDASNKVAYSKQREYLLGDELDSVMNYPFKDSVCAFLMGRCSAEDINKTLMSVSENYPTKVVYSLMNLLGTHDTMRIKSLLGGLDSDCGYTTLQSGMEDLATYRFLCAVFMQMTMPGVPSIYYGDEVGMQGGRDPFNRKPFPWRQIDMDTLNSVRKLGEYRNTNQVFKSGYIKTIYAKDDVFVYLRFFKNQKDVFGKNYNASPVICAINRSFDIKNIDLSLNDILKDTDITDFNKIKYANTILTSGDNTDSAKIQILSDDNSSKSKNNTKANLSVSVPAVGYTAIELNQRPL